MKLQFLGGTRQVTGSRYYLQADGTRLLVDCGMFQERDYLDRNWDVSPVRPRDLAAVLVTHAHIDHCGLAPKLVQDGLRAPIYATPASVDLMELVLRDAAEIQEEDAAFKRKRHRKEGRKGKYPVQPLYTLKDVDRTLPLLEPVPYDQPCPIANSVVTHFRDAGHILGSAMIEVRFRLNGASRSIVFSGDIGQWDKPLVRDPTTFVEADYIVMESTYGDRNHEEAGSIEDQLTGIIRSTFEEGGKVIIPVFAIERTQELIYHLGRLVRGKRIPEMLVFLDSPMAADVIEVFRQHSDCFDDQVEQMMAEGHSPLGFPGLKTVRTIEDSKAINALKGPAIIMATSGMCTAGRIKHHLAQHISNPACTVLFVGYQARNTLGRQILDGNPDVRIHGRNHRVRARVAQIFGFSGHADRAGLLRWLGEFKKPPIKLFLTHGEEQESLSLANHVRETMGWNVVVPEYQQVVDLE
ncbi:MAG: MBL fold metallo-hydrolase RNA specificity domain-containing protein [Planctomycetota bacterium]